jgi:MFS transporter, DHA1 family, multidrug resistance protein
MDAVRDSTFGQLVRHVSGGRYLAFPEQRPSFQLPTGYEQIGEPQSLYHRSEKAVNADDTIPRVPNADESDCMDETVLHPFTSREQSLRRISTSASVPHRLSQAIAPVRKKDGITLVDWYDDTDPANPQNWSAKKKIWVSAQICAYTFSVYIGSSLYTASELSVAAIFNVSDVAAALGLALYVLAYGIGPMLWSPLSEIPSVGRNPLYIWTYLLFVILCIPTALVDNFAGLLVLRFLLGFFGSPCLATGGASFGDMFPPTKMPYAIAFWAGAATLGPALGESSQVAQSAPISTYTNLMSHRSGDCWFRCVGRGLEMEFVGAVVAFSSHMPCPSNLPP